VKKHGRARKATDDSIKRRMRSACWIIKAADTNLEYEILIAFPRQQRLRERPSYYVIPTFPVLLYKKSMLSTVSPIHSLPITSHNHVECVNS
jgi:hypothetical protein